MASSAGKKKGSKNEFIWSDDEVELLLNVASDYKVLKAKDCTDWESVKTKYKDIYDLFIEALPPQSDGVRIFPHNKDVQLKHITSKLKAIRLKFRQAVDSGHRSGHGRVVMLYFELCENVWVGSPATAQIQGGIETVEITSELVEPANLLQSPVSSTVSYQTSDKSQVLPESDGVNEESNETVDASTSNDDTVNKRRKLLDEKLKGYKHDKMKRKLQLDAQILGCAQEESTIKNG